MPGAVFDVMDDGAVHDNSHDDQPATASDDAAVNLPPHDTFWLTRHHRSVVCMLTIFSIPKPFLGHIGVIQRNAVKSWLALRPECEVILLGDEEGTATCAQELGVRHCAGIARNEYGTPLLDDAFARVTAASRFPRLCYVNADIILPAAFLRCVERVALAKLPHGRSASEHRCRRRFGFRGSLLHRRA